MAGSSWQVLIGEGHAPEQVTLYCAERNLLLAADQILPRISPVIGVWAAEPDADPLGDFLRSLRQYRALPEDCHVLPSHGLPFLGLHERLDQLVEHHEQRLERTLAACAEPATAAAVLRPCFRARSMRTRPASRWPRRWRTSTGCCEQGSLGALAVGKDGVLLYRAR